MTNAYYNRLFDVSPLTFARSGGIESEFERVEQGFDAVQAALLDEAGGGVSTVADVAALRLQPKLLGRRVSTRAYLEARPGIGGAEYVCDTADTTSPDNGGTVIVGADGGRWKLVVRGPFLPAAQCGVAGNGVVGDTARLVQADAQARALGKTLYIEGVPLLDAPLIVSNPTSWYFAGAPADMGGNVNLPASYLKVSPSATGTNAGVSIASQGVHFHGGGVIGDAGWLLDGLQIGGNGFSWTGSPVFARCGRDGIRIGSDDIEINANSIMIDSAVCAYNARHGLNIDDPFGAFDANTFDIRRPRCYYNGGHGIRLGRTMLGGVITAPQLERNAVGLYMEAASSTVIIIGGNIEDNTGPNGLGALNNLASVSTPVWTNVLLGTTVQGVGYARPLAQSGTWLPQPYGATFPGGVTYTNRKGTYSFSGGCLHFQIHLSWTSHGGTGQLYVSLPELFPGASIETTFPGAPNFMAAKIVAFSTAVPVGQEAEALIPNNTSPLRIQLYVRNGGTTSALPVPTAAEIFLSGSIPLLAFP